jgi:small subunit ribosomal protein S20e
MDTYTDKGKDKGEHEESENPIIRITLKSQEVKNLEYVSSQIIRLSKEKLFTVKGPRFMPNKVLRITTRKSPCGNGNLNLFNNFKII